MSRARLLKSAVVIKPSTILGIHRALVARKYRLLFAPKRSSQPGPKGPSPELVAAIVEMKRRNPRFGYQGIAAQLALVFDVEIDKGSESSSRSRPNTTAPARIGRLAGKHRSAYRVRGNRSNYFGGKAIAAGCSHFRFRRD